MRFISKYAPYIAFVQAWLATLGSLYFSEVRGLTPCILCWYQRIFMYPLIFIIGVAIIRKDKNIPYFVLPLSIIGAIIALYQYLLQMTGLAKITPIPCTSVTPCSQIQVLYLGFITIPFLSLMAFLVISALMIIMLKSKK